MRHGQVARRAAVREEKAGHTPDVYFESADGRRYRFDRYSERVLQPTNPGEQAVLAGELQREKAYRDADGDTTAITNGIPRRSLRDPGRRRWVLTAIDDGHGRPEGTNPVGPGWTAIDYFERSDLVRQVYRKGGKLKLEFHYKSIPESYPNLPRKFQIPARTESLGLLSMVQARLQASTDQTGNDYLQRLTFTYDDDDTGNLLVVERRSDKEAAAGEQRWEYTYVGSPEALGDPTLAGEELWAATNELEKAQLRTFGSLTWRGRWERSRTWSGFPHQRKFEVVDGIFQTGTSTVSAEGAVVETGYAIAYDGATKRNVTRPDGIVVAVDLNDYGNVTAQKLGMQVLLAQDWYSDVEPTTDPSSGAAGMVRPSSTTRASGTVIGSGFTDRLLPKISRLEATSSADGHAIAGVSAGNALSTAESHDERFGVPKTVKRPLVGDFAAGAVTASFGTELDPSTGDVKGLTVTGGGSGEALFSWKADGAGAYDEHGVLLKATDAVGRTVEYLEPNELGLRETIRITAPSATTGGRAVVAIHREYDRLGRLTRQWDDVGVDESWTYDDAGRLRQHVVEGTPKAVRSWTYQGGEGDDVELVVTETLASTAHRLTKTFRDGLLVKETFAFGPQATEAERTFGYVGGRIATSVDEREIERTYCYAKTKDACESGAASELWLDHVVAIDRGDPAKVVELVEVDYERDAEGKVLTQTDAAGLLTTMEYDWLGRPAKWDYGAEDVETVTRNADGAVVRRDHGRYAWFADVDALGRVRRTYGYNRTELETATDFDGLGRMVRRVDVALGLDETWRYADALGRLTEYERMVQPGSKTFRQVWTYRDAARPREIAVDEFVGGEVAKRRVQYVDAAGRVLETKEYVPTGEGEAERRETFGYDPRGLVLTHEIPVGAAARTTARWTYDAAGNVLTHTDHANRTTRYVPDAAGLVTASSGPHSDSVWSFEYDGLGRLTRKVLAQPQAEGAKGGEWKYEYAVAGATLGATVRETDPRGFVTDRTLNARGRLVTEKRSGDGERTVEYALDGPWVKKETTTEGSAVTVVEQPQRDARGRVWKEIETFTGLAGGYVYTTDAIWNGRNAAVTQSWAQGSRSGVVEVDSAENVIRRGWGGFDDRWEYDAAGRLASETPAGTPQRKHVYVEGLRTEIQFPGEVTRYAYHPSGQLSKITAPSGLERRLYWNGRGLLEREESGCSSDFDLTAYEYDAAGNVSATTRGVGAASARWEYDHGPREELLSVTQPGALGRFQYGYDELAQLVAITPPQGPSAIQTFGHDALGREKVRTRGTSSWTTAWESGAAETTDPTHRKTKRYLDGRGRLLKATFAGAPSELSAVTYQYDPENQPVRIEETRPGAPFTIAFEYDDPRPLPTAIVRGGERIAYGYTAAGLPAFVSSPGGRVDYDYDATTGRLAAIRRDPRRTAITWEAGGERILAIADESERECRAYDARGRLRVISNMPGDAVVGESCETALPDAQFTYHYDGRGNRIQLDYLERTVAETTYYGYDAADRLTGVLNPDDSAALYRLANDGSRTGEKLAPGYGGLSLGPDAYASASGTERIYTYDGQGALDRIVEDGSVVADYTVDDAGRVLSIAETDRTRALAWDADGRVRGIDVTPTGGATTSFTYEYDHAGRRIAKHGPVDEFRYLWGADGLVEEIVGSGDAFRFVYERAGELVTGINGQRVLRDGLGSIVGRVGSGLYKYDAWGNFTGASQPTPGEPSLAYAGQHWDADAGLSYAQQRWYQPETGRFLSEDPVFGDPRNPASLHAWAYANGNPLLFIDPLGEASRKVYFRQEIEALPRGVREAILAQIDPVLAKANYLGDLGKLSDEQLLAGICTNLDAACDESGTEWLWEQGRRKFGPGLQAFADRVSESPAADAVRAIRAKAAEVDESLRDTATGTYRQALGPTANAIASSNMRPADAAPQVLAQTQAMSRKLGDATIDVGEEVAKTAVETLVAATVIRRGEKILGKLRALGPNTWESSGGLVYGPDKNFGNRVRHVLAHAAPDASKPLHSVFSVGKEKVLTLVDEAWGMRGAALPGDPGAFVVRMGRTVGTAGETAVKIIVRPGTNKIITAHPVFP